MVEYRSVLEGVVLLMGMCSMVIVPRTWKGAAATIRIKR